MRSKKRATFMRMMRIVMTTMMRKCCRNALKMLKQLFWGENNVWCGQRTKKLQAKNTLEVEVDRLKRFILVVINNLVGVLIFNVLLE